jgi:CheY-like chemotaxis protein
VLVAQRTRPDSRMPPADPKPTVFVVDDNPGIRRSLQVLAEAAGLAVVTFAALPIVDFLQKPVPATGLARALGRFDTP